MKSLPGRQGLPQAGNDSSVFLFPSMRFLEVFQFLRDYCSNSLSAKVRRTSICLFNIFGPCWDSYRQREFNTIPLILARMTLEGMRWVVLAK